MSDTSQGYKLILISIKGRRLKGLKETKNLGFGRILLDIDAVGRHPGNLQLTSRLFAAFLIIYC